VTAAVIENILDLPFVERPILELLHFDDDRSEVDREYAGFGWARIDRIWLGTHQGGELIAVEDALVLALHSDDAGLPRPDDVELAFELPDQLLTVSLCAFLDRWLPRLPRCSNVVLAMCNPHHATLRFPTSQPLWYPTGDTESWIDDQSGGRIELLADGTWARVTP
jgi:hypothetical protein